MSVELIKMDESDAEIVFDIQVNSFLPLLAKYKDYGTSPANESIEHMVSRINYDNGEFFKIMYNGEVVGGIFVRWYDRVYKIGPIFVSGEYQGKGIAQRVMLEIENRYNNAIMFKLDTIEAEKGNCYLYEKLGYVATGETRTINELLTLVYYEKNVREG